MYVIYATYRFTSVPNNNWTQWYSVFKTTTTSKAIASSYLATQSSYLSYRLDGGYDMFPQTFVYVHTVDEHAACQVMMSLTSGTSYTINLTYTVTRIA